MADGWQCGLFWWIFALTVVLPFVAEMYVDVRLVLSTAHSKRQL